jgi:hypothetical protein
MYNALVPHNKDSDHHVDHSTLDDADNSQPIIITESE